MRDTTLLFLIRSDQILLAMKRRGVGVGFWNGVGGKIEPNETVEQAVVREYQEEIGVTPKNLEKVAHHTFKFAETNQGYSCHTFIATDWANDPTETEEMTPKWFPISQIPYHQMWEDDKHWLPKIINGQKLICEFIFDNQNKMLNYNITSTTSQHELLLYEY